MNIWATLLFAGVIVTQAVSPQDRAAALKESIAQNQAALRRYT